MFLYHIDKKPEFALKDRAASIVLIVILSVLLASYSFWNFKVGFMGQYIRFNDNDCTLVYSLTEKGEYEVVNSFHDGNVINVPEKFNGKPVTSINCSFLDTSITKIVVNGSNLKFNATDQIKAINEDFVLEVSEKNIDNLRFGLFKECWTADGDATNAKTLFDCVTPADLGPNDAFYNVSYTDKLTSDTLGYIGTIVKKDGAKPELVDLKNGAPEKIANLVQDSIDGDI